MRGQERRRAVETYFEEVNKGDIKALTSKWSKNGVLRIVVEPDYKGLFRGSAQIEKFYQERFSGVKKHALGLEDHIMDIVETDDSAKAYWRRTVKTKEGYGFDMIGVHEFRFADEGIAELRIIAAKPAIESTVPGLNIGMLGIADIGKLAVMAWRIA